MNGRTMRMGYVSGWLPLRREAKGVFATMRGTLGTVGTLATFLGKCGGFSECLRVPFGTVETNAEVGVQESGFRSQSIDECNRKNVANLAEQVKNIDIKALTTSFLVRPLADQQNVNLAEQGIVSKSICKVEHYFSRVRE
jgi:hypothetical protein